MDVYHALSVLFGGVTAWGTLSWLVVVERRLNLAYEDRVDTIAIILKDVSIPWDYAGCGRRLTRLYRCFGLAATVHMLAQTPISDRLAKWNGVERRAHGGSYNNRRPGEPNRESKRVTDSLEFYLRIAQVLGKS